MQYKFPHLSEPRTSKNATLGHLNRHQAAIMTREKPKQDVEDDAAVDDNLLLPRTRRQAKLQVLQQDDASSDEKPSPSSKVKFKSRTRKSVPVDSASPTIDSTTGTPDSTPAPTAPKRKGGNKRKFTHEYCLTCRHYGRACGGRREDEDGCAVCRDPNREKGEKLRECLWANPEAGINTYQEARIAHKAAQVEARVRNKARAQELKRMNSAAAAASRGSLGLTVSITNGPPPPVGRQLNVLPPLVGTAAHSIRPLTYYTSKDDDNDTITVDTSLIASESSPSHLPGIDGQPGPRIHRPQVIKLIIRDPTDSENTKSPSQPAAPMPLPQPSRPAQPPPPTSRLLSFIPPPIPTGPPYYDHKIQAWRYPSQAGLYLPSPPLGIPHSAYPAYQSPYGPPPAFANSGHAVIHPPSTTASDISKPTYNKPRPLDKSGMPCRKWSRSGSDVPTLSGHTFKMKGWKPDAPDTGAIDETRDDISSSDLSSVIDVEDLQELEKAVQDANIKVGFNSRSTLSSTPDVTNSHKPQTVTVPVEEEDPEDRLQAQINRMAREAEAKFKLEPKAQPQLTPKIMFKRTSNGFFKINNTPLSAVTHKEPAKENKNDADITATATTTVAIADTDEGKDDGPLTRLPSEIRDKLSRTATTHIRISDTETITVRPEHFRGESLGARLESRGASDGSIDNAAATASAVKVSGHLGGGANNNQNDDAIEEHERDDNGNASAANDGNGNEELEEGTEDEDEDVEMENT